MINEYRNIGQNCVHNNTIFYDYYINLIEFSVKLSSFEIYIVFFLDYY